MHRLCVGIATLFAFPSLAPAQPTGPAKAFGWSNNYGAVVAEAKRTGKPIFLVFRCEP